MSMVFLFWLSALYTLALFSAQFAEFLTAGRLHVQLATANALYLALLSTYVGGKEIKRWTVGFKPNEQGVSTEQGQRAPFRLKGEWFVGLWVLFLLAANLGSEIWPARFAYPKGLTLIAFEVLGFYIGSSASRWLNDRIEERAHVELEQQLEAESGKGNARSASSVSPVTSPRLNRKRLRYEKAILEAVHRKGGLRRQEIEALLGLSRAASLRIIGHLMEKGLLKRTGEPGDPDTLYQADSDLHPAARF